MTREEIKYLYDLSLHTGAIHTQESRLLKLIVAELDAFSNNVLKRDYDVGYNFESLMLFKYKVPGLKYLSTYRNCIKNPSILRVAAIEAKNLIIQQINIEEKVLII